MGIYSRLEDGYYRLVEKVDGIIPIAGLVDRVDKIMPSFVLFIILIALIALGAYFFLLPVILPQEATLAVKVVDESGSALPNASVTITYAGISKSAETKTFGDASFTTNIGASVAITTKKANYKTATATIQITKASQSKTITLELSAPAFETKEIKLLSAGMPIVGRAELSFACENARAPQIGSITIYTGEAEVQVPSNCGKLYVSVKSDTYKNLDSYAFADQPIYLEPLVVETGTISVSATFLNAPIAGIRITAYNEAGLPLGTETTNSSGQAALTLNAGNYRLKTYDPNNLYAQLESGLISLSSEETEYYDFNLSKNIAGFVQIQVLDKSTKSAVADAQVQLKKENDDIVEVLTVAADANGIVKFNVADATITYKAVIDHPDYLIGKIANITAGSATYIAEIEKYTGANGGTLKVKVVNEAGKNVQNARAALYNSDSGFLAGYGEQVTDINGIASFTRVQNGNYNAFAYKSSASGKSETEFFDMRLAEDVSLDITMAMGDGLVNVNVTDVEGIAIAFAKVDVYDALDNSLFGSDYTDANGIYRLSTKADKKVYVIVSKEGKADYISAVKSVIANTVQTFTAEMEAPTISGNVRIRFLGLYKNEKIATSVVSDEEYIAKFQLVIPEEKNYTGAGIHVRTGSALIMEKDSLLIKEVNIPNATIFKYTSYGNGYSGDVASITSAEAKWFNATLSAPKAGIYNAEATILIKSTASITDKLTIDYRAWANDGTTERDKECTVATYDLYCTTYQQIYQLGAGGLCDDDFCFEASITDLKEEIASAVLESYQATIYNRYMLSFSITNNSKTEIHNNANLRIKNPEESLLFDNYTIYDSEGVATSGTVNGYEFPWLDIGNFAPNSKVSGTLYFTTQKSNAAMVEMRMVSDYSVVFEKDLIIATSAPNTMDVKISPTEYPSGIENDITVTVKDAGTQLEIEDVIVKLKDRQGNLIAEEETAKDGTAKITMPAQLPGEKLTVEVSKPEYDFVSIELAIEDGVLSISPDSLGVSLNIKDKSESSDAFTIENLTHFPLKILSIALSGDFKGYVDIEKSNNWLFSYAEQVIVEESTFEASFKSYLTDSGKQLTEAQTLKGTMTIEAGNFDEKWVFTVPVTISIGIGKEVTPGCFAVTQSSWEAMTEGNPIVTEFQIQNGCAVDSTPVTLYNLRARIDWETNEIGTFVITVNDGTSEIGRELRSGYARTILNSLAPEASLSATITFSPYGGTSGNAKAKIVIEAVNYSEHGEQVLSDEIEADITVVNLRDCITFSKELLEMYSPESDSFTIETKDCGGTTSFTIRSDLEVTPTQLDLESSDTSSEIQVLSEGSMYGQYPIEVLVKGAGEKTSKPVITLRARVKPPIDSCIQLNRFEYDVYDDPGNPADGFDTSELTNQCYDAQYDVKLKGLRSWSDAFQDGIKWGLYSMIGGMISGMFGLNQDTSKAKATAGTVAASPNDALQKLGQSQVDHDRALQAALDKARRERGANTMGEIPAPVAGATGMGLFGLLGDGGEGGFFGGDFWGSTKNSLGYGLVGMFTGTLYSYFNQEDKGTATTIQRDVEITDVTLNELTTSEELDTDLNLSVGEEQLESESGTLLNTETRSVKISNITQKEGVFFKIFNVQAKKYDYDLDKEYEKSVPDTLDVEDEQDAGAKFRVQFNAVAFDENVLPYIPPEALDCRSSTRTGITGSGALPKVKFAWDWSSINEDACNADNADYVFCDATQFSIAVLEKIELIRNFISLNAPFTCPSAESALSTKTQEIPNYDIGISSMKIEKIAKDVNVLVEIENRDPSAIDIDLNVTIRNTSTNAQQSCLIDGENVLSKKTLGCYFANLEDAQYAVSAEIDPDATCSNCLNNSNSDSLASFFSIGAFGLELCEPYTTARLRDFVEASESAGKTIIFPSGISSKDELLGMVDFSAYLMQDRFSPDFHNDFHNYAMTISFFDAPSYYTDAVSGLGKYFSDSSRFKFAPKFQYPEAEGFLLNGPGAYNVDINMTFDAGSPWEFFDSSNEPIAEIRVSLDKADVAIIDSPLYYMPFDGPIGADNSRVGYGLNYSGASILLNQSTTMPIRTIDISASTPIPNGTLRTTLQDDFTYLNNTEKGILLKITKTRDADPQLVYAPSYATPVMMKMANNEGAASALYSVSVANGAQDSGYFMAEWSGVGYNCKTFDGGYTVTDFANTKDIHALPTTNLSCTPIDSTSARTTYGFEFCEPAKFGNMFLKTLFYTPQQKENLLTAVVANDSVAFVSPDASGSTNIPLGGVSGMENNQHGADTIDSIEDIFDLVENELACVTSSSTSIDFWWNPKPVMTNIESEEIAAEKECIT